MIYRAELYSEVGPSSRTPVFGLAFNAVCSSFCFVPVPMAILVSGSLSVDLSFVFSSYSVAVTCLSVVAYALHMPVLLWYV